MKKLIFINTYAFMLLLSCNAYAYSVIVDPSGLPTSLEEKEPWSTSNAPAATDSQSAKSAKDSGEGKTGDQKVADLFGNIGKLGEQAGKSGKAPDANSIKGIFGSQTK